MTATARSVKPADEEENKMEGIGLGGTEEGGSANANVEITKLEGEARLSDRQLAMKRRQDILKRQREEQERIKQEHLREEMEKQAEKKRKKNKDGDKSTGGAQIVAASFDRPADVKAALLSSKAPLPSRKACSNLDQLKPLIVITSAEDLGKIKADQMKAQKMLTAEMERVRKERERLRREKVRVEAQGAERNKERPEFPTDDLFIEDLQRPLQSKNWVKVGRLPQELVSDVLMIYDFLRQFGRALQLSPITMDQLLDALTFPGDTVLLAEVHMAILRTIVSDWFFAELLSDFVHQEQTDEAKDEDDDQSQTKMDVVTEESAPAAVQLADATAFDGLLKKGFEARLVRPATWPGLMRELLPRLAIFRDILDMAGKPSDRVGTSHYYADILRQALNNLETTEYAALCLHDKVVLLKALVDAAYETVEVSNYVDRNLDNRKEVLEKKRSEEVEERRKLREENAGRRQEVIKRLKQKMEEDWKAINGEGGTGKDGTAPKMPKFNPTPAQINAELETLISMEVPGSNLEVRELPDWDHLSDDDELADEEESAEVLERLTRLERNKRKKDIERKQSRRRQKEKERERRLQKDTERAEAISILDDAVKGGRGDAVLLRRALQAGRTAGLEGDGWCTMEMKEAYKALMEIEQASKRTGQQQKLARDLEQYSIRTEPFGYDRDLKRYYRFDGDPRLWVEEVRHAETGELLGDFVKREVASAKEEDERVRQKKTKETQEDMKVWKTFKQAALDKGMSEEDATAAAWKSFSEQLPAEEEDVVLVSALARMSRLEPSNFYSQWSMIDAFEDNIKSLLMRLDTRGTRERELRQRIVEKFPELELTAEEEEWDKTGSEYLWKRVRRVYEESGGGKEPAMGYIVGWLSADKNDGMALWHMEHDDADEEDLEEYEVIEAIRLAQEYEAAMQKTSLKEKANGLTFRKYSNLLNKDGAASGEEWLGLQGLKRDLLSAMGCVSGPLKERGSDWVQDGKAVWERNVSSSDTTTELGELMVTLEEMAHAVQEDEDIDEEAEALAAKARQDAEAARLAAEKGRASENGIATAVTTDEEGMEERMTVASAESTVGEKSVGDNDSDETVSASDTETEDEGPGRNGKKIASGKKAPGADASKSKPRRKQTIWSSVQERKRWIVKVRAQRSSGCLGLALICLKDRLKAYGLWDVKKEATSDLVTVESLSCRTRKRMRG